MATTKTTIYDTVNKKNLSGYIKDGATYLDNGSRITAGMQTVDSSGRLWQMGADGKGSLVGDGSWINADRMPRPESPTKETDLYALQEKARIQALEKAKRSGLSALDAEKSTINPYYNQNNSNIGGQSALGARNLQEYLAQRGMTNSGVSAQAEINRVGNLNTAFATNEAGRANALSDIERRRSEVLNAYDQGALQAALQTQIDRSQGQREDFLNTIGAYGQDYQAQINNLRNDGDKSNDWQIPYLNQARNEKISGIAQSEAEAQQQAFDNWVTEQKLGISLMNASKRGTSGTKNSGTGTTEEDLSDGYSYPANAEGMSESYEQTYNTPAVTNLMTMFESGQIDLSGLNGRLYLLGYRYDPKTNSVSYIR